MSALLFRQLARNGRAAVAGERGLFGRTVASASVGDENRARAARYFDEDEYASGETGSRDRAGDEKRDAADVTTERTGVEDEAVDGLPSLLELLDENKVSDIRVIDATEKPISADEIVLGTTLTAAHGLAVGRRLSRIARLNVPGGVVSTANVVACSNKRGVKARRSRHTRDASGGRWIAVKVSRMLVHLMTPAARAEMDLDSLWGADAPPLFDSKHG